MCDQRSENLKPHNAGKPSNELTFLGVLDVIIHARMSLRKRHHKNGISRLDFRISVDI